MTTFEEILNLPIGECVVGNYTLRQERCEADVQVSQPLEANEGKGNGSSFVQDQSWRKSDDEAKHDWCLKLAGC